MLISCSEGDDDICSSGMLDNHEADIVQVLVGTVTRARVKRFKEGLIGLIREVWDEVGSSSKTVKIDSKFVNMLQVNKPSQEEQIRKLEFRELTPASSTSLLNSPWRVRLCPSAPQRALNTPQPNLLCRICPGEFPQAK